MKRCLPLLLLVVAVVSTGCSKSDDAAKTTSTTTAAVSSTTATPTTGGGSTSSAVASTTAPSTTAARSTTTYQTSEPAGQAASACAPYVGALALHSNLADIANGSHDAQVQADAQWATFLKAISAARPNDASVTAAVATLSELSFQVSEMESGPNEAQVSKAFDALDAAFGADCSGQTAECPSPETLAAEGYTCDSEGNLTPIPAN